MVSLPTMPDWNRTEATDAIDAFARSLVFSSSKNAARALRGVSGRPERDVAGDDAPHVDARVQAERRGEAAREQTGAGDQHHRHRDLRHHQRGARAPPRRLRRGAAARSQALGGVRREPERRGDQRDRHGREERPRRGGGERAAVHAETEQPDVDAARQLKCPDALEQPPRDRHRRDRAGAGEDRAFERDAARQARA